MAFTEYKNLDLVKVNAEILDKWNREKCFENLLKVREGAPEFVFFEGPPSANGMPGIHHVMARSIKDAVCRFKSQSGYLVNRKAGWDTHGLPVELGVEKKLGITKEDIGKKISVDEYNDTCRKEVMKYTAEWVNMTQRVGYWVDMDNPYITYDNRYIETLWWLLKQLYDKDLLYKGYTIQPYSPAAGTGLSTHELNQPGCYRDVKDTTCTAIFKMKNPRPEMTGHGTACFIAWTTTPWTLPSNTALCVGPKIDYVAVQCANPYNGEPLTVVMAEARLSAYFKSEEDYTIVGRYKGTDLVGLEYEQLFPWVNPGEGAFRVIPGDYVTTEDGTGIVHIAPTFGADDAKVAKAAGVPPLYMVNLKGETRPMVDFTGKFYRLEELDSTFVATSVNVDLYSRHAGEYVKNAYDPRFNEGGKYDEAAATKAEDLNVVLCIELKQEGKVFKIEKHVHNYPHCWRTDKPVLYYPLDSWFIRSTACRERMMELNESINWRPESTGSGRFGKWLENLNDWNLSRSRYWGTPLPIWRNADTREQICIGSVEELYNEIEKSVAAGLMTSNPYKDKGFVPGLMTKENYDKIDLHRPYVDDIILVGASGSPLKRETDLIDVWFDSGAMPYAQVHYPFENKEALDSRKIFPADFIAEGVDQTRGWFFTLHAIGTMVFDSVAYKNVVSNGLVLDKNGMKMSKRLGNAVNPFDILDRYGADPLRWYMLTNAQPWDNLKFDEAGVDEVRRKFFGTLYNTYSFFALYANVDGFDPSAEQVPVEQRPEIDRWIISSLNTLVKEAEALYEQFDITTAGRLIDQFVEDNLSNWYVRLNRKRFWGGGMTQDKLAAYQTLYECLSKVAILAAPIAPFYMERLYLDLHPQATSVHYELMPKPDMSLIDSDLEERMQLAQQSSSMILALRRKVNIKVRQPLSKIIVPVLDVKIQQQFEQIKQIVMNEVNIKEVEFINDISGIITRRIKPNFKVLGKRYGKQMKEIAAAFASMGQQQIADIDRVNSYVLQLPSGDVELLDGDYEIISEDMPGWLVASEGRLTIALDITITDELRKEGVARELINRIQNLRKDSNFEVTDKVRVRIQPDAEIASSLEMFGSYVCQQTLCEQISQCELSAPVQVEWGEGTIGIEIEKI